MIFQGPFLYYRQQYAPGAYHVRATDVIVWTISNVDNVRDIASSGLGRRVKDFGGRF